MVIKIFGRGSQSPLRTIVIAVEQPNLKWFINLDYSCLQTTLGSGLNKIFFIVLPLLGLSCQIGPKSYILAQFSHMTLQCSCMHDPDNFLCPHRYNSPLSVSITSLLLNQPACFYKNKKNVTRKKVK